MKNSKLRYLGEGLLIIIIVIMLAIGLNRLHNSLKESSNESSFIVDRTFEGCYDDCSDVAPLDYEAILAEERVQQQEEHKLAVAERKRQEKLEEERIAQEKERERLAQLEREKEEERKKKQQELEKERLARLEEKKKQPQTQLASRGTSNAGQWIRFEATHYGANCYKCSGITATGIDIRNTIYHNGMRVIAVDPNVIPLGSIVEVQTPHGTFKAVAGDTGGRIKGYIIDILVESEEASKKYGRVDVQLRILNQK